MHITGFATCLCAEIAVDGTFILANAGHLAPYLNGQEVLVESSLPLGVTRDTAYTQSTLRLSPGDSLTCVSDGVVEAQSTTGELFGFDRTRAISIHSAAQIAKAAQAHGQEDDITVLTLTFAPVGVAHA
jgi:serine phosphatase RsbU (regulator of sigma subunit)